MGALTVALEFARTEQPDDPFAFRDGPQRYTLRTDGGGVTVIDVAWDDRLRADLAALARRGCDPAVVQRVGEALRTILLADGWDRHEQAIAAAAGQPVRVTLRSAAAELYALPWELVTVGASGRHLGELEGALIEYAWPETRTAAETPAPRPEGGRIVCAWSAAGGAVPAAEHVRAIAEAAAAGGFEFDASADVLPHATLAGLARALEQARAAGRPIAALHLLCHGGRRGATVGIWLNGQAGDPVLADPADLRRILAPHAGGLRLVVLAACSAGDPGELGNSLGSAAQAIHRAGVAAVVASRFPLTVPGSVAQAQAFYRRLLVDLGAVEDAVLAARSSLARDAESLDWAGLQLYARPEDGELRPLVFRPYRGLLAYEPEHARFFFGREGKIKELQADLASLRALGRPRMIVVAGASGTGKSSLVLAGAAPRLLAALEGPELVRMKPGREPLRALQGLLAARREPRRPYVLVVDQFEEVFTHAARADAQAFAQALWRLAGEAGGPSVIVTLRIDFIGACAELALDGAGARLDQLACDPYHAVLVPQMAAEDLRAVIERPAALVGLSFEPGLVGRILDDLAGAPGSLPLLADTLDLLWQRREGATLTQRAYEAIGGVTGALEGRAEALVVGLDEPDRRLARQILVRLVSARRDEARDTRQRVRLDALRPADAALAGRFEAVVRRLVDERLAIRGEEAGEATLELAHEALIRRWARLQGWLRDDAEKLAALAEIGGWIGPWKSHGTLLIGHALGYTAEIARRYPEDISADARGLLEASLAAEAARQARRRRALVGSIASAVLLAALAVTAGLLAVRAREAGRRADARAEEAAAAEKKAARAVRRTRDAAMLSAARLAEHDHHTSALLLREIASPELLRGWLAAAAEIVHGLPPPTVLRGHAAEIRALAFSGDGAWLATAAEDRTVRLAPVAGGPAVVFEHPVGIVDVAVSPDGGQVATAGADQVVRLWRRAAPRSPLVLPGAPAGTSRIAFGPDGSRLAAAGRAAPTVWSGEGTGGARHLGCPGGQEMLAPDVAVSLAWSGDGRRLAAPCPSGVTVWTVDEAIAPVQVPSMSSGPRALRFDRDGQFLMVLDRGGEAVSWRLGGREPKLSERRFPVLDAGFAGGQLAWAQRPTSGPPYELALLGPSGDALFVLADGRVSLNRRTGESAELRGPPALRAGERGDARFPGAWSPDGRRVAVVGSDLAVRVWTIAGESDPPAWPDRSRRTVRAEFRRDGAAILLHAHGFVREVPLAGGAERRLERPGLQVSHAAYRPDGSQVAVVGPDGVVLRWWPATGEVREEQELAPSPDHDRIAWSPDGGWLAVDEHVAYVWRVGDASPPRALGCQGGLVSAIAWSPGDRALALGCSDGWAAIHAVEGEAPPTTLPARDGAVHAVAWSPDGQQLAVAHAEGLARIWRRDGAGDPRVLRGHTSRVIDVAWSPDGERLATAGRDGTARLWSASGEPLRRIEVAAPAAHGVRFSGDGQRLLVWSSDGEAQVVVLSDGGDHPIVFPPFGEEYASADWSPDGRRFVVAGLGGAAIRLVDRALLQAWLSEHVRGCLSEETRVALLGEEADAAAQAAATCESGG